MAKSSATWEGRRALTDNPNTEAGAYKAAARELLEKNLLADAATFFAKADDKDSLRLIAARAVSEGDFFLFQAAAAHLDEDDISRAQLMELRANAEKGGKLLYAARAAKALENF